jgi:hypothetical protein
MQEPQLQKEVAKNRKQQAKLNVILTVTPLIENILITLPE